MKRALLVTLAFSVLYSLWFQHRPIIPQEYNTPRQAAIYLQLFHIAAYLPYYFWILVVAMEAPPNIVSTMWNKLASHTEGIGYIVIGISLVLAGLRVPGIWWSWMTIGLVASTMLIVYLSTRDTLGDGKALVFSVGVFAILAGIWEIIYQVYCTTGIQQINEISVQVTFILGGAYIVGLYCLRYKLIRFHLSSLVFAALFVGAWIVWVRLGFYLDYIHTDKGWVLNTPPDTLYIQSIAAKSSKVWLNLVAISLLGGWTLNYGQIRSWTLRMGKQVWHGTRASRL